MVAAGVKEVAAVAADAVPTVTGASGTGMPTLCRHDIMQQPTLW